MVREGIGRQRFFSHAIFKKRAGNYSGPKYSSIIAKLFSFKLKKKKKKKKKTNHIEQQMTHYIAISHVFSQMSFET